MILNAAIARDQSETNKINKNKLAFSELETIENAINDAITQGKTAVILNFICSPMAIKELQDNRYKVNCKNFTTYINW